MAEPGFPGMRWHPKTGENRIFQNAEDVPEGWLAYHPADSAKSPPPPQPAPEAPKPSSRRPVRLNAPE